uniref:Discoidin domain-containing receptor 2 n=1 Tax=Panagrolaimus sp. JU765 TaxID=591449 RepID=A0AC34QPD2_9BILA
MNPNWLFLLATILATSQSLNLEKCDRSALGMESGEILDEQITASSSFDEQSVGPQNARIRTEKASGAWCPKTQIRNGSYEFLQVNLNLTHLITTVETQGRYGNGTGAEFTNQYFIDYFRSGGSWIRYRNRSGHELMSGNSDTASAVLNSLDPPIVASKIRFVPYSEQTRTTCLRVELYGCEDFEHLDSYSASKDGSGEFKDRIFEATKDVDRFIGGKKGLGLLTDGLVASSDPQKSAKNSWIGWKKNDTQGSVILIFEFDRIRNFTDVVLFAWGEPIDQIHVEFSDDGNVFDPMTSVLSTYPRALDPENPTSYSINIPLPNRSGKFVRFRLTFQASWIYLTEIEFNTVLLNETIDMSDGASYYNAWYFVMVAIIVLLFLVLFAVLVIICWTRKRTDKKLGAESRNLSGTKSGLVVTTLGGNGAPRHVIQPPPKLLAQFNGTFYGEKDLSQRILSRSSASASSGTVNKDTPPSLLDINFPPPPPSTESSECTSEGIYCENNQNMPLIGSPASSANNTPQRRRKPMMASRKNKTLPHRPSVVTEEANFAFIGHPTATKSFDQLSPIVRIPQKSITLIEQIGEGKFTAIFLCEIPEILPKAVIKVIKDDAEDIPAAAKALHSEAQILSKLDHPNLIRLYGVSEDYSVIVEHIALGSIREFIQSEREKLNFGSLLHFVTNIASGMKYLEQNGVVHGHLSVRNCLVESNLNVKIAGPRGQMHHAQLRYSAPECIILNEWTHKSDAWSFGTTAWEILHYCTQIPFENLTNQQIVDYARQLIEGAPQTIQLEFRNELCPPEIRDLLKECCLSDPLTRPAFLEIQLFLSRKAMSFTLQNARRPRPTGLALPQSVSLYK